MHFGHIFVSLLVKCNYFYSNVGLIDYLLGYLLRYMVISFYYRLGPFCTVDTVKWEFVIRKIYQMFYFHLSRMLCAVQDCCIAFSHLAKFEVFLKRASEWQSRNPTEPFQKTERFQCFEG